MRVACLLVLFLLALVQLGGCLLLGAFNIKTFGDKKSSNSTLMDIITQVELYLITSHCNTLSHDIIM